MYLFTILYKRSVRVLPWMTVNWLVSSDRKFKIVGQIAIIVFYIFCFSYKWVE